MTGTGVVLRAEPSQQSVVLRRLRLNTAVQLLRPVPDSGYCEVALDTVRGFTACQYLGMAPVVPESVNSPLLTDGSRNPDYDPVRSFWHRPSWDALQAYGMHLNATRLTQQEREQFDAPRPPDPDMERMKEHLARGIHGARPASYPAWEALVQAAQTSTGADAQTREAAAVARIESALGLWGEVFSPQQPGGVQRVLTVPRSISLPATRPSLFRTQLDVGGPGETAEELGGRFGIVHLIRTRGRKLDGGQGWTPGAWDIGQVSVNLARPVVRTAIHRDGRLAAVPTHALRRWIVWGDSDGPMCEGHQDGFSFGDADPQVFHPQGLYSPARPPLRARPDDRLLWIHTRDPLPREHATVAVQQQRLNRATTGFVSATQYHYDLDGDGAFDLSVWEGTGRGPGHLDGPPKIDDAWLRVFFVNIAGRWHVLGRDAFSYGCGC